MNKFNFQCMKRKEIDIFNVYGKKILSTTYTEGNLSTLLAMYQTDWIKIHKITNEKFNLIDEITQNFEAKQLKYFHFKKRSSN